MFWKTCMQMCACTNHTVYCIPEADVCLHQIVHMGWQSARSCLCAALHHTVRSEHGSTYRPGTNLKAVGRQVLGLAGSCLPVWRPPIRASTRDVLKGPAKAHCMSDVSSPSLMVLCSFTASSCPTHLHVHCLLSKAAAKLVSSHVT